MREGCSSLGYMCLPLRFCQKADASISLSLSHYLWFKKEVKLHKLPGSGYCSCTKAELLITLHLICHSHEEPLLIAAAETLSFPSQVWAKSNHVLVYRKAKKKKKKWDNQSVVPPKREPSSCDPLPCAKHYEGQIPALLTETPLLKAWNETKETRAYLHCVCFVPIAVNTGYDVEDTDVPQSCSFNEVSFFSSWIANRTVLFVYE